MTVRLPISQGCFCKIHILIPRLILIPEVPRRAANEFGIFPVCWAIQSDKTCTAFMALKDRKGISDFLAKKMKELRKGNEGDWHI